MSDVFLKDGTVLQSAEFSHTELLTDQKIATPMIGIILSVSPSDQEGNLTADHTKDSRGWRHECTVLVVDSNLEPNLILENVVIPPSNHSGMDNFQEDLPRGIGQEALGGKQIDRNFANLDFNDLDVEWCIVNFIGGSIDRPFVQNWWYHPRNTYDPAKSGGNYINQVDIAKNKFRLFRRLNGTYYLINKQGDVYLNTTEANSTVNLKSEKHERILFSKGGSIQIDLKNSQQLEFNWNPIVEGLGAGSSSQSQIKDTSLPHKNYTNSDPKKRETKRSFFRVKEFDQFFKSSSINIYCENTEEDGGKKGEYIIVAQDQVLLCQQAEGELSAIFSLLDGKGQIVAKDGSILNIGDDEASFATKSGATVAVLGDKIVISAPSNVGVSAPVSIGGETGQPAMLATSFSTALTALSTAFGAAIKTLNALVVTNPDAFALQKAVCACLEVLKGAFVTLAANPAWVSKGTTTI